MPVNKSENPVDYGFPPRGVSGNRGKKDASKLIHEIRRI